MRMLLPAVLAAVLVASSAPAGWDPGDEDRMHYPQLPDLSTNGMDVLSGPWISDPVDFEVTKTFLADNFEADRVSYLTDIHVWASVANDGAVPTDVRYSLGIYEGGAAQPGTLVWDAFIPADQSSYATADESFYDPVTDEIVGPDTQVQQLSFSIPRDQAFCQEAGQTYWLGLSMSMDFNDDGIFDTTDLTRWVTSYYQPLGWKTSGEAQFGAGAMWSGGVIPDVTIYFWDPDAPDPWEPHQVPTGGFNELAYPAGHALAGQNMDLAFVVDGALVADFDDDGDVDDKDIDALCEHGRLGIYDPLYDITADGMTPGQDGLIDCLDVDYLVHYLVETSIGLGAEYADFNLDGKIDVTDLTRLATNYGPDDWGWADGNANPWADGDIDNIDLTILATYYGTGPGDPHTVPEPASAALVLMGGSALLARRRKGRR